MTDPTPKSEVLPILSHISAEQAIMTTGQNSTTGHFYQPATPFFADPANSAPFITTSLLLATLGNYGLQSLRQYASENQYAVLSDHLEAYFLLVVMVHNINMVVYGVVLTAAEDPGHVFCACSAVAVRLTCALCLAVLIQSSVMRLLYLTVWKNVGAVNDDFFQLFLKGTAGLFALLYGANLAVFQGYRTFPTYQVCRNQLPCSNCQRGENLTAGTHGPDLISAVMCLAAGTSLALMLVLQFERAWDSPEGKVLCLQEVAEETGQVALLNVKCLSVNAYDCVPLFHPSVGIGITPG